MTALSPASMEATTARRLSPCGTLAPDVNVGGIAGSGGGVEVPVTAVQGRLVNEAGRLLRDTSSWCKCV